MLVLSRRIGESIQIGDNITITINDIDRQRGQVKIACEAPKEVLIFRKELLEKDNNESFDHS